MKHLIKEVKSHVKEQFKINDEGDVFLVDGADESVEKMVRHAHLVPNYDGSTYPSTFVHNTLYCLLDEYDNADTIDDLYTRSVEPDVYNYQLEQWVSSHTARTSYADEAIKQLFQMNSPCDYHSLLRYAQSLEIEEIKHKLAAYLEEEIEHRLENEDEVEV